MTQRSLCLFLACFLASFAGAQEENNRTLDYLLSRTHAGIRLGSNFPTLRYANSEHNAYRSETYSRTMWGIFADIALDEQKTFSLRPEINFTTRGQHIDNRNVTYTMDARYTDIYLPLVYTFRRPGASTIAPFVLLSPVLGIATGGKIGLNGQRIAISDANLSQSAFGLYAGAGVNIPVRHKQKKIFSVCAELGYHLGLSDTYSRKEKKANAVALNLPNYTVDGTRKHAGFQASIALSVPLSIFRKEKKPAPVAVPEPAPAVIVPATNERPKQPEKPCYTLEEMKQLIDEEKDITGKKICAIDRITFEFGKSTLQPASLTFLNEIAALMRENTAMKIIVNGHTDNVGSAEYNLNLSKTRAMAVHNYLLKCGIEPRRLTYKYFGMTRPIAGNDTEEGRIINRRVEFEIINQ
jgi:OOP family OmpA-OmpF porin